MKKILILLLCVALSGCATTGEGFVATKGYYKSTKEHVLGFVDSATQETTHFVVSKIFYDTAQAGVYYREIKGKKTSKKGFRFDTLSKRIFRR